MPRRALAPSSLRRSLSASIFATTRRIGLVATCALVLLSVCRPAAAAVQGAATAPAPQAFPATNVGTTSSAISVTFTVTTAGTFSASAIPVAGINSGDFAITSDGCGTGGSKSGTCTVMVTFTPRAPGLRMAAVNVTGSTVATALIYGTGNGPLVSITPGTLSTIAGTGTACASPTASPACGDNGSATSATLSGPFGAAIDGAGNIYIADQSDNRIRKVTASNGNITTVAGNGTPCAPTTASCGDAAAATSANLLHPSAVAVDGAGNLYIADLNDNRIRKVTATTGIISTVAGNGTPCAASTNSCGDTAAATSANLRNPTSIAVDGAGNLYIADTSDNRIRKVTASNGIISTVAGSGTACSPLTAACGDGALATATTAYLNGPTGVTMDAAGNIYIADTNDDRVRKVAISNSFLSTVAGNGTPCTNPTYACGDGTAATSANLFMPEGIAIDGAGNLYIADTYDNRIRKVSAANTFISTIAGVGNACGGGTCGDNSSATASTADFYYPVGIALDGTGNIYIADSSDNRIRKVTAASAPITFASEQVNTTTDAAQTVTLTNNGNQALAFTQPYTNNPSLTGPYTLSSGAGSCTAAADTSPYTLASGATCTETISFAPVAISTTNTGTLTNTDNSNNPSVTTTTQTVSLTGASTGTSTTTSLSLNPSSNVSAGQTVTLTANITASDSSSATGSVQFYDQAVAIGGANAVSSGVSTYQDTNITAGTHGFIGVFTGTGVYAQSSSTDVMLSVAPAAPAITAPTSGATVSPATTISGTAAASSTVTIYDSGTAIGSSTATSGGTFVVSVSLAYGSHTLTAKAANSGGTSPASTAVTINVVQAVGSTGPVMSATVTFTQSGNSGTVGQIYVLTTGQPNLDFAYASGGTCTLNAPYNQGDTCTVKYTFTPKAPGQRLGAVQLLDGDGVTVIGTAYIADTGNGAAAVFPTPNTAPTAYSGSGFTAPYGVAVDAAGDIYVADLGTNSVSELIAVNGVVPTGTVSTPLASLYHPKSVAVDGAGNVYITAADNNLYEIVAAGGQVSSNSAFEALATYYSFVQPSGVAVDGAGNVYVADSGNNVVVEFKSVNGNIPANPSSSILGSGFSYPISVAVDGSGNVYVVDYYNNAVKEMIAVNGSIPASPTINTLPLGSSITQPYGVAVDAASNVYVTDQNSGLLSEILAVNGTVPASSPTILTLGQFGYPGQIAIDGAGNAYVGDPGSKDIGELTLATAPSLTFKAVTGGGSASQTVLLENAGNASLNLSALALSGSTFSSTNSTCTSSTALAESGTCNLVLTFTAPGVGTYTGTDKLTDNSLKPSGGATQTIALTGTATYNLVFTTAPPASLQTGQNAGTVVATIENFSGTAISGLSQNIALAVTGPNNYSQTYNVTSSNGVASFNLASAALTTTGAYTYAATSASSSTGTASETVYPYQLAITSGPATPITAGGNAGTVQVTVENNDGSTATTQTSTVTLTVTGPSYSQTYPATPSNGIATFNLSSVPLNAAGTYSYTATSPNLTTSPTTTETVNVGSAASLVVTAANSTPYINQLDNITVTITDAQGNPLTSNTDSITLTASPTTATGVPVTFALASGTATEPVTFTAAGSYTLTATDNTTTGITGAVTVTAQPIPTYTVTTATDDASGVAANCNNVASGATPLANCSLRDAFAAVTALDFTNTVVPAILFKSTLNGTTITLTTAITVTGNVALTGPAAPNTITLSGSGTVGFLTQSAAAITQLTNLIFTNFKAASGGVLNATASNNVVTLTNDQFLVNTATGNGGAAVDSSNGTLTITGCTFSGNSAGIYNGGAVYAYLDTAVNIYTSTFGGTGTAGSTTGGNTANAGGAIYLYSSNSAVYDSLFVGNYTAFGGGGGAVYTSGGTNKFYDTTFTLNVANGSSSTSGTGGALYQATSANNYFYNVTVTNNTAHYRGGGVYKASGSLYAYDSIIEGNSSQLSSYADVYSSTSTLSASTGTLYNISSGGTSYPVLSALGNYGGPTLSIIPLPGSPALRYASSASTGCTYTGSQTTDQRGYPRVLNGACGGSGVYIDAGATQASYTLAFAQQPSNGLSGANLSPAPTVQVYESGVALNATPPTGGTVGSLVLTNSAGTPTTLTGLLANSGLDTITAKFPSNQTAETLNASLTNGSTTIASVTSNPFNITSDYIWLVDNTGALNKVSESGSASGSAAATSGTASLGGIAFDSTGNTWSVTSADNALAFTNYAQTTSTTYTGGGLNTPVSIAVDGANTIWVANKGNNSISQFTNSGTAITPAAGYTGAASNTDFATPTALVLDNAGGVWVTNKTGNSVTHVFGVAAPVITPLSRAVTNSTLATKP